MDQDNLAYLRALFLQDTAFLDVRAEVEFEKGAFPTSINIPILTTEERHRVGSCYKQKGQDEAIKLGHHLVSGNIRQSRIDRWSAFVREHNNARLYCWRGGLRSNLTHQWLEELGIDLPVVPGGFKALRAALIAELEAAANVPGFVIAGKTGSAKTHLINRLATGVDLEGIAHHRGSSFGRRALEPPTNLSFENSLAIDLLKKRSRFPFSPLFFEDESRMIGPVTIPLSLWKGMQELPILVVESPLASRVEHVLKEYVVDMLQEHCQVNKNNGEENYRQYLLNSLDRIKKKLGMEDYLKLQKIMNTAIDRQLSAGDISGHEAWIHCLLEKYYDPMYVYQLKHKQDRIVFSGDFNSVLDRCSQLSVEPS